MQVLNAGECTLIEHMSVGSDLGVVQSARISNGAALPEWRGASDERLINFLAENDHMTPFEHNLFSFYVKAPIFVIREWQRHRTFSYNEMSARYRKLEPTFFVPESARGPHPTNKQSSVEYSPEELLSLLTKEQLEAHYNHTYGLYNELLEAGLARELARSILPVGIYSEMIVSGNFRNWMHFWWLRTGVGAQQEIRDYANAVGEQLQVMMPLSFAAMHRKMKHAD